MPLHGYLDRNRQQRILRRMKKVTAVTPLRIMIDSLSAWTSDRCANMAAALAFYAAFSLAPMLVIVINVAGFFFGADAVQGRLYEEIRGVVGMEGATAVQAMVASAWKAQNGGWTTLVSILAASFGASATFAQLNVSLNTIWGVKKLPTRQAMFSLVKVRLVSFGLVIGIAFLIVVLLVFDAAFSLFVTHFVNDNFDTARWLQKLQHGLSILLLTAAFAVLLKALPETYVRWRNVIVGAITAALLFALGKHLFGLYLARAGTANAFGAAGSLAVLLMWLYFSSAVFLLGAEIAAHFTANDPMSEDSPATDKDRSDKIRADMEMAMERRIKKADDGGAISD